jgi:hypothetical protein
METLQVIGWPTGARRSLARKLEDEHACAIPVHIEHSGISMVLLEKTPVYSIASRETVLRIIKHRQSNVNVV